jgi:hypothetical protein
MNNYSVPSADPQPTLFEATDAHMDYDMSHSGFFEGAHQQHTHDQPMFFEPHTSSKYPSCQQSQSTQQLTIRAAYPTEHANNWHARYMDYQLPIRPQHLSISTQSSYPSFRSSGSSFLSNPLSRFSAVSSISSCSNNSMPFHDPRLPQTEHCYVPSPSAPNSHASSPVEAPCFQPSKRRTTPRAPAQEKDYYKTCVSRKQRARRCETVQKYFCTICEEAFAEKADWKRHEETYQERPDEYQCDFCTAKYFLDKDFVTHHVKSHGCQPCSQSTPKCSEKRHVQSGKKKRKARTGWGCGFCTHFTTSWTDRCHHIARHFEKDGKIMADWNHSVVIMSLIQRPAILEEWNKLLQSRMREVIGCGWDKRSTGRVEGYPDSNRTLQLQDALEFYTPDQDAAKLARAAYDQAAKKVTRKRASSPVAPPVPQKDYRKASLDDIMKETESWAQVDRTIIDEEWLPTGVAHVEDGTLDDASVSLV